MTEKTKTPTGVKWKIQCDTGFTECYDHYKQLVKDKPAKFQLSKKEFRKIISTFHTDIIRAIIDENYVYKMPVINCTLRIKKYKQTVKFDENGNIKKIPFPINWKETLAYWKENPEAKTKKIYIYYLNDHTDGYRYRYFINRRITRNNNLRFYCFKATRINDRLLSKKLLDIYNTTDYYE